MPLIIAHRGASAFAPENTLAAFRRAIECGADGIEFDVRLARDGVPVVIHDSKLERLGRCAGRVENFTSAELRGLDVGSWFNEKYPRRLDEKFSAECVPTLESLLKFFGDYAGLLYVEMKCDEAETAAPLAEAVCRLIENAKSFPQKIIVKSFNLESVALVKKILPEVRAAALFEPTAAIVPRGKNRLLEKARRCAADEISIHRILATRKFVSLAAAANFPVTVWTADNPAWVKRAIDLGVGAIITNDPARLVAEREKLRAKS